MQQQRGAAAGQPKQVDELAERLRELARRQLQRPRSSGACARGQQGGGSGGDAQRALADELEQAARQLEQLAS